MQKKLLNTLLVFITMFLFVGASVLPIISGTQQNLLASKNAGKHNQNHAQKIQKNPKNNLGKNSKADSNIHTQPTKNRQNPKTLKQKYTRNKHETTLPSFAHDATLNPTYSKNEGTPLPLGNNVHNVRTGANFATIQAAIDAAGTLNGDTLLVSTGTYPENVLVSKSLTIRGNGSSCMPIINGMGTVCFNITANSVTLKWLNFTNATNAINCSATGFTVVNNTFYYTNNGLVWRIYKTNLAASQTILASMVKYNTFYSNNASVNYKAVVYVDLELYYQNNSGFTVSIGDITINQNTFYLNSSVNTIAIYFDNIYIYYLFGGTITVGKINVSGNTIYGGDEGLGFYGEFYQIKNVQLTVGDYIVTNNRMMNQTAYAMDIDYYDGTIWSGTTNGVFGKLQITDNIIQSTQSGLYGIMVSDYGYWYNFTDTASLHVGDMIIQDNDVNVTDNGIYFDMEVIGYWHDPLTGHSSVTLGDFTIDSNTVATSSDDAIYIYIDEVGYYMYDYAAVTMGDFSCNDNTIFSSGGDGIYVSDIDYIGNYMHNATSCTLGDFQFKKNTINSLYDGIYVSYFEDIGEDMYGSSTFTMGDIQFNDNQINANDDSGLYFSDIGYFGYNMYNNTQFTMGSLSADNNTVFASSGYGISFDWLAEFGEYMGETGNDHCVFIMRDITCNNNSITNTGDDGLYVSDLQEFGYDMHGSSTFTMGNVQFNDNTVNTSDYDGIYIYDPEEFGYDLYEQAQFIMGDFEVNGNTVYAGDGYGIYLYYYDFGTYLGDTSSDSCHFTMGNLTCNDNNITNSGDYGMYIEYIEDFGYDMHGSSTFTMGNIEFDRNWVNTSDYDGIYFDDIYEIGYDMYDTSEFTMGDFSCNDNVIQAGDGFGIYLFWSGMGENMGSPYNPDAHCVFTMGNLTFNNNTITNSGSEGLYTEDLDDFGEDMYGSSTYTMGNIQFNHNTIHTSDDSGLYLYDPERFGWYMYNNSQCHIGNLEANYNTIIAGDGNGIYMYYDEFGYHMGQLNEGLGTLERSGDVNAHCVFTMGDIMCDYNNITNSGSEGIYLEELDYIGYDMYGYSTATIGNITINHNNVNTTGDYGLYIWWLGDIGENLYDNAKATVGNIEINNNFLNNSWGDGLIYEIGYIGNDLHNNATVIVNQLTIALNTIISGDDGITDEWSGYIGEGVMDNAHYYGRGLVVAYNTIDTLNDGIRILGGTYGLTVGANTIIQPGQAIHVKQSSYGNVFAYNIINGSDNDSVLIQDNSDYNTLLGNKINDSMNNNGVRIDNSNHTLIVRNTISNNSNTGIILTRCSNTTIYHNNILNNTQQAYDDSNASNTWDNGYPSGGNYWSDYTGIDIYHGPNQNITGGDGIGDTPYNITGYTPNDQDRYPFTNRVIINHSPLYNPSNPSPTNGSAEIPATNLNWTGGDPDYDYNNYDVYFGTTNPPQYYDTVYLTNLTRITYNPGILSNHTTYYWKIIAWDAFNETACGPTWKFYTSNLPNDTIPPEIIDNTPSLGYTNNSFTFNATITDNDIVTNAQVEYWYGTETHTTVNMTNTAEDFWVNTIIIANTLDTLHYCISAEDPANNWNTTIVKNITIIDNVCPIIVDYTPFVAHAGDPFTFNAKVTDNVMVSSVWVEYWANSGPHISTKMTNAGGNSWKKIIIINLTSVTLSYIISAVDSSDNWVDADLKTINIEPDHPPKIPVVPSGPSSGKSGIGYTFTTYAADIDSDQVYYLFDWGDGTTSGWIGPFESGAVGNASHSWTNKGSWQIKAKAKDVHGVESGWSSSSVFNVSELKKAFIFGKYTNISTEGDLMTVHAVNLRIVLFKPFQFLHYIAGEKIAYLKNDIKALITHRFIIGIVDVVI